MVQDFLHGYKASEGLGQAEAQSGNRAIHCQWQRKECERARAEEDSGQGLCLTSVLAVPGCAYCLRTAGSLLGGCVLRLWKSESGHSRHLRKGQHRDQEGMEHRKPHFCPETSPHDIH